MAIQHNGCELHQGCQQPTPRTPGSREPHTLPQHDTHTAGMPAQHATHRMCPLKVRAAARWLGTSTMDTSGLLGLGSVSLLYLLGITNDISTSPASSFDSDSVPDMSMRTGELQDSRSSQFQQVTREAAGREGRWVGGWRMRRVPAAYQARRQAAYCHAGQQSHCHPACSPAAADLPQPALPDPAAPSRCWLSR